MKPTLLILAAGVGSRYGGLKQMDGMGPSGETLLDYSVYDAIRAGFGKVVFVIRKDIEADFKEIFHERFSSRFPVEYVFQELTKLPAGFTPPEGRTKPWGTVHAVLMGEEAINEPFCMINADDFYGFESFDLIAKELSKLDPNGTEYINIGYKIKNTLSEHGSVARGILEADANGNLTQLVERTKVEKTATGARYETENGWVDLTGDEPVSMNFMGFPPSAFPLMKEYFTEFLKKNGNDLKAECFIPNFMGEMSKQGKAHTKVISTPAKWFGVTYREDRQMVVNAIKELVAQGKYPEKLWS
ncbi:sugar phosphate nucleotidyltransferase [Cytophagaceae bacterium DM2B3-1]|uniref:Sugar phosphate nucleotidyltransferase n=2 Tax=Xanthocytophaga TaxID=3078918 RepID=A0ABT7CGU4_9BACT|nr:MULTISPECIES: sugar phosphate nucleotidyltransferase [Xanthocytophaga]MDJ1492741.1 sugar phosphate nucleotidyltransferase [Xanthocytophaga flavus]MDJ1500955.1 sugar phosphate nucleotidyltransferase [Xanthocytophaga agilis]